MKFPLGVSAAGKLVATAIVLLASTAPVSAHGFGKVYTLPVPVWMYLYGAAAALLLSFLVVGYFVNAGNVSQNLRRRDLGHIWLFRVIASPPVVIVAKTVTVFFLALTIASGFVGSQNAYANFSMTMFWIIFVLAYAYLTALIGNTYAVINPWLSICQWIEKWQPKLFSGRTPYPESFAYWPAIILYMGFIWFELFGESRPFSIATALSGYTLLNIFAAYLFGRKHWFQYGEFFSVFFRIIGQMAPFTLSHASLGSESRILLRQPFIGLTTTQVTQWSLLIFVLFMLSSTAFDGLKSTVPYVSIYWKHLSPYMVPYLGGDIVKATPQLRAIYPYWQALILALSPFLYLLVYLFFIWLTKLCVRSEHSLRELAFRFAFSLVPIAFVYNVTHYYTLVLSQGTQIINLFSDPFGYGWNLIGTADWQPEFWVEAGTIWHTQVWLILFGHIISVYLAHLEALTLFGSNRRAALSQIPMLFLMVALTTVGLWILSLPISRGV